MTKAQRATARGGDGGGGSYFRKPGIPFVQLITDALNSSDRGSFFLTEIYDYITSKYDYYKFSDDGWKNSIRHALSASDDFVKLPAYCDSGRRKCEWALNSLISGRDDFDVNSVSDDINNEEYHSVKSIQLQSQPQTSPLKSLKKVSKRQSLLDQFPMLNRVDKESIRTYLGTNGSSLGFSSSQTCDSDADSYALENQEFLQQPQPIMLYSITDHPSSSTSLTSSTNNNNTESIMPPNSSIISERITEIEELQSPLDILQRMSGFEPPGFMPSAQEPPTNQLPPYLPTSPLHNK